MLGCVVGVMDVVFCLICDTCSLMCFGVVVFLLRPVGSVFRVLLASCCYY